jgi:hypothetical protein
MSFAALLLLACNKFRHDCGAGEMSDRGFCHISVREGFDEIVPLPGDMCDALMMRCG